MPGDLAQRESWNSVWRWAFRLKLVSAGDDTALDGGKRARAPELKNTSASLWLP